MPSPSIPQELRAVPQWVVWKYEERDGKRTKVPYRPATGERASTTDAASWSGYEAAAACAGARRADGVGFVFSALDQFVGVDLDGCVEAGTVAPWAMEIVGLLNSYTEVTPSGTGLHILCKGKLPPGGRRKGKVEIYEEGRYFTVTGRALKDRPPGVEERGEQLIALHQRLFPPQPAPARPTPPLTSNADPWSIIERVLRHPKEAALWRGITTGYESASEADLALVGLIAFYAGPDPALIDQVMRQSDLRRDKWDSPRPGGTYGSITIAKALAGKGAGDYFDWHKPLNSSHSLTSSRVHDADSPLNSFDSLSSYAAPETHEAAWPADLAAEAFHGAAGEIVKALSPETEADAAALLLNLLICMGSAAGRHRYFEVGATRHHTNLFGCLVGYTGEARKGTSWDPIECLFTRALPEFVEKNQHHGGLASGEGLLSLVRDRREKRVQIKDKRSGRMTMEFETVVEDEGVDDKRCLVIETEMAGLLKIMNRPGNVLSQQLCKAWETGTIESVSKNTPTKATGAHISVLGHITPDSLKRNLLEADAASGFGNRFLWILVKRSRLLPSGGNLPLLNSHVIAIRELVELASDKIMQITRSPMAEKMWKSVYGDLVSSGVGMFGEMTARRAPIVMRLSLIYALWDGVRTILPEHLLAALAVWERCEASVRFLYGDLTGDPLADTLYEAMLNRPEGAHRTDLHNALGRNRPVAELDRALTALQRSGRARMQRQKGEGGREVEGWYAAPAGKSGSGCGYLVKARAVYENDENDENSGGG